MALLSDKSKIPADLHQLSEERIPTSIA